jgi:hypothetical protein
MRSRNMLLATLIGVCVAGGSALAARGAEPAVAITNATVTAKWKESYMKGSLSFTGTTSAPVSIEASVRSVASRKLVAKPLRFSASSTFSKKITLGAQPVPGQYRLHLENPATGNKLAEIIVTIPAPPEGVIDEAYMTNTKNGRRMKTIKNAKIIYAHIHFSARPQASTITFKWQKPGNPKVRFTGFATQRYAPTMDTFVCVKRTGGGGPCLNKPLRKGKWYLVVIAGGQVVKRQDIRVT